jgi:hypothetical protein
MIAPHNDGNSSLPAKPNLNTPVLSNQFPKHNRGTRIQRFAEHGLLLGVKIHIQPRQ